MEGVGGGDRWCPASCWPKNDRKGEKSPPSVATSPTVIVAMGSVKGGCKMSAVVGEVDPGSQITQRWQAGTGKQLKR